MICPRWFATWRENALPVEAVLKEREAPFREVGISRDWTARAEVILAPAKF